MELGWALAWVMGSAVVLAGGMVMYWVRGWVVEWLAPTMALGSVETLAGGLVVRWVRGWVLEC